MKRICKFKFDKSVEVGFLEQELLKSILTSEDVYGRLSVEISTSYWISGNEICLDVSNEIGRHTFCVFAGRLNRKIGKELYSYKTED